MPLKVIYYLGKINISRPCGRIYSRYNIFNLSCNLAGLVTKRSCDFMEERSSSYITPLPGLAAIVIGNYGSADITYLICHVILQHHVVRI